MFSDIYFRLLLEVMDEDPKIQYKPSITPSDTEHAAVTAVKYYGQLISSAYEQNPASDIGIKFGRYMTPINSCDYSRLLTTAKNVGQCFHLLVEQYHTLNLKLLPMIHQQDDLVSISICFPYQGENNEPEIRFCSETFYSYCLNSLRELIDENINPIRVHLNYPKPQYAAQLEDLFCCPIIFDSALSMIEFEQDILSRELPSWNKIMHEVYLNRAQESWKDMKRLQSFRYRAVSKLMTQAPKFFNAQALADDMNISMRGLQKRLSAEGSSFSHISQLTRRELVKVCLLQRQMNLEETTHILGFQTQASFRRFFKGQFGVSPKSYLLKYVQEGCTEMA